MYFTLFDRMCFKNSSSLVSVFFRGPATCLHARPEANSYVTECASDVIRLTSINVTRDNLVNGIQFDKYKINISMQTMSGFSGTLGGQCDTTWQPYISTRVENILAFSKSKT